MFNERWEDKMHDYEEKANNQEQKLREKHIQEMEDVIDKMEVTLAKNAKPSSELLNLRRIQQNLARQKE